MEQMVDINQKFDQNMYGTLFPHGIIITMDNDKLVDFTCDGNNVFFTYISSLKVRSMFQILDLAKHDGQHCETLFQIQV